MGNCSGSVSRSSGSSASIYMEIEESPRDILSNLSPFKIALFRTNFKTKMNANKLRFRHLLTAENETAAQLVLKIINSVVIITVLPSQIISCKRTLGFKPSGPRDIVVTFEDCRLRDYVFSKRYRIKQLYQVTVCDELCEERVRVWREAKKRFGNSHVFVKNSNVYVYDISGRVYSVPTLIAFRRFVRLIMKSPLEDIHESSMEDANQN